jgi:hypothetical protein
MLQPAGGKGRKINVFTVEYGIRLLVFVYLHKEAG